MTRLDQALRHIRQDIDGRDVLEVGCGRADFSIAASRTAKSVRCIDLGDKFLSPEIGNCPNVTFEIMDASAMTYPDASFGTAVMYNAVGHLTDVIEPVLRECRRVLRPGGNIYIISSVKMDKNAIADTLLPYLNRAGIPFTEKKDAVFTYIKL